MRNQDQSDERCRELFDQSPAGLFVSTLEGQILDCNEACARILGYSSPAELLSAPSPPLFEGENFHFTPDSRGEGSAEILLSRRDGTPVWTFQSVSRFSPPGSEGFSLQGVLLDITARKRSEDELKEYVSQCEAARDVLERNSAELATLAEELQRSERSFRVLFSSIPDPVWVFEAEQFRFLQANDVAVRHYGYSRDELAGLRITDLCESGEADRMLKNLGDAAGPRLPSGLSKHRCKDGHTFPADVRSHLFEFGKTKAILVLVRDRTEQERMEMELRQHNKLEAIGQLAAGLAHEINTPAQYIGDNIRFLKDAFADLTWLLTKHESVRPEIESSLHSNNLVEQCTTKMRRIDLDYLLEEVPPAIDQALDGVGRVSRLVSAMKEFSHPGGGEKAPVDLNRAIANTLTVATNEWKYVAEVATDYDQSLPQVPCLAGELSQVRLNLIVNAAHSIADAVGAGSGKKGTITIQTRKCESWAEIRIQDTGTGIPEAIRARIFDPFFTTKEVGRGSGQGLAIARSVIVDKHGGTIDFETEVGRGTTFIVRLPYGAKAVAAG